MYMKKKFYQPRFFKINIYPQVISKHVMLIDVIYIDGTCQNQKEILYKPQIIDKETTIIFRNKLTKKNTLKRTIQ